MASMMVMDRNSYHKFNEEDTILIPVIVLAQLRNPLPPHSFQNRLSDYVLLNEWLLEIGRLFTVVYYIYYICKM